MSAITSPENRLSIGAILSAGEMRGYENSRIILVARESGYNNLLWGLPAGKIRRADIKSEIRREIFEETGLSPENLDVSNEYSLISYERPPDRGGGVGLGIVFLAEIKVNFLPKNIRWKVTDPDGDITQARIFTPDNIIDLLKNAKDNIFRPEFNRLGMLMWLYELYSYDSMLSSTYLSFNEFIKEEEGLDSVYCL